MRVAGLPELAEESVIAHWRAAQRLSRWLTRRSPAAPRRHPGWYGLRYEALACQSVDGLRLAGWVVEPRRPRATILLFHGLRHNREQTLGWSALLAGLHFRTLAIDFRAHGESEGWRSSFGWWERRDVLAAAALAGERWPDQPCAALGIGMGAAAICFTGGDCPFTAMALHGIPDRLNRLFDQAVAASPAAATEFLHKVKDVTERRLGVRLDEVAPAERLPELTAPLLVLPEQQAYPAAGQAAAAFFQRWLP